MGELQLFVLSFSLDQLVTSFKSSIADTNLSNSDNLGYRDHGGGTTNETINQTRETKFIHFLSTETVDRARNYTFSNWPSITPGAQDMILAGWWYTNIADRVMCIHCDTMFHNWNETDRPYEIHRLKSPRCFYIRMTEEKGIDHNVTNQRQVPVTNATNNDVPNNQTIVGAVNAEYSLIIRRRQTFDNWPESKPSSLPSIESFVEAGFFYTGSYDLNKRNQSTDVFST